MNNVSLIGNLAQDPEKRTTNSGKVTTRLRVAVTRMGPGDTADFFNVITWDKTAENCAKYLKKGSKVGISGRLSTSTWEKDGQKRSSVEVIANQVEFLSSVSSAPADDDDGGWEDYDDVS